MRVKYRRVDWELNGVFRTASGSSTVAETIVAEVEHDGTRGRGEALGVSYSGESVASMLGQLEEIRVRLERGVTRDLLQELLPPGGARNAVDCALWDLECKRSACRAWELAAIPVVRPLNTAFTISLDTPKAMAQAAINARRMSLLKLKLGGDSDLERVMAVREAHPAAEIIVDANQSWSELTLRDLSPEFAKIGVKLIEQPLPRNRDEMLRDYRSPVPLCADESCQTSSSLPHLVGKYDYVNIKLDKTGGLTEALKLARAARILNLGLMVGCMAGSSLSMAPAFVVGQLCSFVDLDGPLLAKCDVENGIAYENSTMFIPSASLWG
jgi:L-Ala-D/L-Glu epimerase